MRCRSDDFDSLEDMILKTCAGLQTEIFLYLSDRCSC